MLMSLLGTVPGPRSDFMKFQLGGKAQAENSTSPRAGGLGQQEHNHPRLMAQFVYRGKNLRVVYLRTLTSSWMANWRSKLELRTWVSGGLGHSTFLCKRCVFKNPAKEERISNWEIVFSPMSEARRHCGQCGCTQS